MARTASTLTLAEGDREKLEKISRTRTEQAQRVDRSRILLAKADGKGIDEIAAMYGVNRNTAAKCVRKYREGGLDAALADAPGRGRPASVGDADKAWVVDLACQRPADLGHAAETWTVEALAAHFGTLFWTVPRVRARSGSSSRTRPARPSGTSRPRRSCISLRPRT